MSFDTFLKDILKDVPVTVRKQFQQDLEQRAKTLLTNQVAASCGHLMAKAIDGVIVACVRTLGKGDSQRVMLAYTAEMQEQIAQLAQAIGQYAPKQLNVELAKATFGDKSREANAARLDRETFLTELRDELRDLLLSATGEKPTD